MDAYVVYDTEFGNTEQVARAVGAALGDRFNVHVASVKELEPRAVAGAALLVLGAPTEAHGISPEMRHWLSRVERDGFRGVRAAAFDTRFHMPRLVTGSAAVRMTARLRRAGCELVAEPESFFVEQHKVGEAKRPQLLDGELERIGAWVQSFERAFAMTV